MAAAAAREDADARGRQAAAPLQRQRMEATTHRDALVAEVGGSMEHGLDVWKYHPNVCLLAPQLASEHNVLAELYTG